MDKHSLSRVRTDEIRLLLATRRAAVASFFEAVSERSLVPLAVDSMTPAAAMGGMRERERERERERFDATVLAVDLGVDADTGIELCRSQRADSPQRPILGVFCCLASLSARHLRALIECEASALDLEATPEEAARVLQAVRGGA